MHPMIRRQQAAQACVDRFLGKPHEWGVRDCIKLSLHVLHKMGHKGVKAPAYRSERGGLRALKKMGHGNLVDAVDGLGLVRIAPAAALPGDLIALKAADGDPFGCALTVALGNGRVLGWVEGDPMCVVQQPREYLCAWRVG